MKNKEELESTKIAILRLMSRQMNGAVVGSMRALENQGHLSYGLSIPTIKEIVSPYKDNHSLALHLYNSNVREMKLAAIYIDDAMLVSEEQMETWADNFGSYEIALHGASMLFYRCGLAESVARKWLHSNDIFRLEAALIIIGRIAKDKSNEHKDQQFALFLKDIIGIRSAQNLVYAVVSIANRSEGLKAEVNKIIDALEDSIKEEVAWQIS